MLCPICSSISLDDLNSTEAIQHHGSIYDLEVAARNGCELCMALSQLYKQSLDRQREAEELGENEGTGEGLNWEPYDWGQIFFQVARAREVDKVTQFYYPMDSEVVFWQPDGGNEWDALYLRLTCCTTEDDPLSALIRSRTIPKSSRSTEVFSTISSWLDECVKDHPQCKPKDDRLPTRIISIDRSTGEARLVVSEKFHGEWVVLSHCWGSSRHGITTTSNIAARQETLDLEVLPQMFRDAVEITHRLGFQYLWIDSLCIIQDSRSDWQLESMKMDHYFMGASLNISASASSATDSTMGIFSTSDEGRKNFQSFAAVPAYSTSEGVEGTIYFRQTNAQGLERRHGPVDPGRESPLQRRAWVLQESQLSSRIVWFDNKRVHWDCAVNANSELEKREDTEIVIQPTRFLQRPTVREPLSNLDQKEEELGWWYRTVNNYMTREITFASDRLPALAGLAKAFAARTGFRYVCGLWEEDLLRGLFWNACRSKIPTAKVDFPKGPPSWSWLSLPTLDTELCTHTEHERDFSFDAELVGYNIANVNDNIYGLVESASLTLKGRCQRSDNLEKPYFNSRDDCKLLFAHYIEERLKTHDERTKLEEKQHLLGIVATLDAPEGEGGDSLHPEAIYLLLGKRDVGAYWCDDLLWVYHALILEPVVGTGDEYRRVGIARIRVDVGESDGWKVKNVAII